MSDLVQPITDTNFRSATSQGVTLVDFWAPWCGPCKQIAPALEELAAEYQGRVRIAKLNVDENPETSAAFGVMSIPTLLLFKDGQSVGKVVGAQSKAKLASFVSQVL